MLRILKPLIACSFLMAACVARAEGEPTAKDREALVAQLLEAFNRQDPEGMSKLVTADVQWLNVSDSTTIAEASSKEELLKGMAAYFAACPSCRSSHAGMVSTPGRVGVVEIASWTKDGVDHTQRSIAVYEFAGELIRRVYYFPAERP